MSPSHRSPRGGYRDRGPKGHCAECGELVRRSQAAVYPVRGYERDRRGGGTNHVEHRERVDGWVWHEGCFEAWYGRVVQRGTAEPAPLF